MDDTLNTSSVKEILDTLSSNKSENNNFNTLYSILEKVEKLESFRKIIDAHFIEYHNTKALFMIYYFKHRQEVSFFRNRIDHLLNRITLNSALIQNFINEVTE